jgi:branched-chain amino acid transport system substrate-binding protein
LLIVIPVSGYLSLNLIKRVFLDDLLIANYGFDINLISLAIHTSYYYLPTFIITLLIKIEILDYEVDYNIRKIPNIVIILSQVLIFFVATLFVLSNVFSVDLTGVLATSGVLTVIIGLAIQPNLSNIFSGLFVNLEKPFIPDDWVTIDDITGQIIDISWRSTRIRTFLNTEVTIPNEIVSKSIITNWHRPDQRFSEGYKIRITLSFHPHHEPQFITQLLYDSLKKVKPVDGRRSLNLQWVKFIDVDQYGMKFAVNFDCTNRELKNSQENEVLMEIHKTMRHAGVTLTAGRLTTQIKEDVGLGALKYGSRTPDDFNPYIMGRANPYNESIKNQVLLQKVPIFNYLNTPDIQLIAEVCERKMYEEKEYIVKQNDNDQSLFIIADGVVSVQLNKDDGSCVEIDKLGVGDFFGEMSLMTGEPRVADIVTLRPTLVLEIKKEIMEKLLTENSTFSDKISVILAERQIELSNARLSGERKSAEIRKLSNIIKTAIMKFFH